MNLELEVAIGLGAILNILPILTNQVPKSS